MCTWLLALSFSRMPLTYDARVATVRLRAVPLVNQEEGNYLDVSERFSY